MGEYDCRMAENRSAERERLLTQLADEIEQLPTDPFVRVAVDGVDGSGKTKFADELRAILENRGRHAIHTTIDKFHNPRSVRYALGKDSPEGFYRDSFNLGALKSALLQPLGPSGNGKYRLGVFDLVSDAPKLEPAEQAPPNSILILDGVFLHQAELIDWWTMSIWLDVEPATALTRWRTREGVGSLDLNAAENSRYIAGQQIYIAEADPKNHATRLIDNNDLLAPRIIY